MSGISSIGFVNPQTCLQKTKSLGFGNSLVDAGNTVEMHRCKAICIDAEPETPYTKFEAQVLANQQKMLGLLNKINDNTCKPDYRMMSPG